MDSEVFLVSPIDYYTKQSNTVMLLFLISSLSAMFIFCLVSFFVKNKFGPYEREGNPRAASSPSHRSKAHSPLPEDRPARSGRNRRRHLRSYEAPERRRSPPPTR